ncbi:MAG: tRNA (N(6)-L-threonylcarbamoyladenosine(37)-C(2))-methylthiotransferase [Candidatus Aenigmarchaeota archaeon]|nr:tRNA (N(6)-L-threonylcarbamoyladenosine(37)-C(2))-methylthiotransferase [Candidatus Aenigmarchaeota archaeon]
MEKVFVESFGCSANHGEGEVMKGLLHKSKFQVIDGKDDAEIIVMNICTVKGISKVLKQIRKTKEEFPHKKLVIAGCVSRDIIAGIKAIDPEASLLSTHNIHDIVPVVEETLNNNPVAELAPQQQVKLSFPKIRRNPVVGIVPISNGCDSSCTFCSTKLIKGWHKSYPVEALVDEVKNCVADGCKEVWLTGQDTSCYGQDIGTNLPFLLKRMCEVEGDFKIRLGMANPKHFPKFVNELIEAYKNPKMFRFLHMPVQSGNNEILKAMKRDYTLEQFEDIVREIRAAYPDMTLSTDIIVGFPGETRDQFVQSLDLIKKLQFDIVNISRFAPRSGTIAAKMENQIEGNERKERSRIMTNICEHVGFARNQTWKKWEGEIVIDEQGKNETWVGRNYAYKTVVVQGNFKLGQKVKVKITDLANFFLWGEVFE